MEKTRETWVDFVKIYACILVVLGHFFPSMVDAKIIPNFSALEWFRQTIYYFHVPLFFICSGFLYQKYSLVRDFPQWKNNALKKVLDFGIPYFTFSIATYVLKVIFSGFVNREVDGFFKTIFLHPLSPYWYLYALLFVFVITFTISNNKEAILFLGVALVMKLISFFVNVDIALVKYILENEIWFVIGMMLSVYDMPKKIKKINILIPCAISLVFIASTIVAFKFDFNYKTIAFLLGCLGCAGTLMIFIKINDGLEKAGWISKLIKYSFPIFLMHTIFAAGFRSVLFKLGVTNSIIHIAVGLIVSFLGPIIAAIIMSKVKFLEFLLYPSKVLKNKSRRKNV